MLQFIVNICMLFCNLWEISYALISFEPQNSGCIVERLLVPLSVVREKQEWVGGGQEWHTWPKQNTAQPEPTQQGPICGCSAFGHGAS